VEAGKILVCQHDGTYVIKLVGDVRVTLCTTLNNYLETIFKGGNVSEVVVDMLDTDGVDSTTLGLLAKLAIHCNCNFNIKPTVFCPDDSLYHTLDIMGLDDVFDIVQNSFKTIEHFEELPTTSIDEREVRERVLEAHRLLSQLNEENKQEFVDLIHTLEQGE
jgi:anti-anti-sigma factor